MGQIISRTWAGVIYNKMKQKLIQEKTLNIKIEYIKQSIYVKYYSIMNA